MYSFWLIIEKGSDYCFPEKELLGCLRLPAVSLTTDVYGFMMRNPSFTERAIFSPGFTSMCSQSSFLRVICPLLLQVARRGDVAFFLISCGLFSFQMTLFWT